ncbi:MAG: hypothetical protein ACI4UM_06675 [Succinivibrio sp.]
MPQKSSELFFVDAYSPNRGEPGLCLEYGVLRWSNNNGESERPEVYIHSYLKPTTPGRINWSSAFSEMKISSDYIDEHPELPTIDDMIDTDYLKGRKAVCFNEDDDPFYSLVSQCSEVISIQKLWAHLYEDDESALACNTLNKMCDYIGVPPDNRENTNYTPLLKRLHKMVALFFLLQGIAKAPKKHRKMSSGGMQFTHIWPLPSTQNSWFGHEASSFAELSDEEINVFFNGNLADRIDWYKMSMYAYDWVYNRDTSKSKTDLFGRQDMSIFIFNEVLSFQMQMWVLIFYSIYTHRQETARQIALSRGNFVNIKTALVEHFSNFIIDNLDAFLNSVQKTRLVASLISQSLSANAGKQFEHFDYDSLRKKALGRHTGPKMYFTENNPHSPSQSCHKEIRDSLGKVIYIRYEVKGRGRNREENKLIIVNKLKELYNSASNPFSDIWLPNELKLWIQYITGCSFSDITRISKATDSEHLQEVRTTLRKIIEQCAYSYLKALYDQAGRIVSLIQDDSVEHEPVKFNFQGISIEVTFESASKSSLWRKLFTFS